MKALQINITAVEECVSDTFSQETGDFSKDDNYVMYEALHDWQEYGTHVYPSLVINKRSIRGRLTPDNAFEAICASFQNVPKQCMKFYTHNKIAVPRGRSTGVSQRVLLAYIIVIILMNLALIIAYRAHFKREM